MKSEPLGGFEADPGQFIELFYKSCYTISVVVDNFIPPKTLWGVAPDPTSFLKERGKELYINGAVAPFNGCNLKR